MHSSDGRDLMMMRHIDILLSRRVELTTLAKLHTIEFGSNMLNCSLAITVVIMGSLELIKAIR